MKRARRTSGFSFVEVAVALVSLSIVALGVFGVSTTSADALGTNATRFEASNRAHRALVKLERHLRAATFSSLRTVPDGFVSPQPLAAGDVIDDLSFEALADPEPNVLPEPVPGFAIAMQAPANEPENGVDDDGDGTVDEKSLVLTRPGHAPEVLTDNVTAFQARLEGRTLALLLRVSMRLDDGSAVVEEAARRVEFRND